MDLIIRMESRNLRAIDACFKKIKDLTLTVGLKTKEVWLPNRKIPKTKSRIGFTVHKRRMTIFNPTSYIPSQMNKIIKDYKGIIEITMEMI